MNRACTRPAKTKAAAAPIPATLLSEQSPPHGDVLSLIAVARTNAEIARDLSIDVKTVKGHVGDVLAKLGFEDRTQAAVFAWKAGVVRRRSDQ